jgi:peroxiredoxin
MNTQLPANAGRNLLIYGIVLTLLGPALLAVQLYGERLETPWFVPIFATVGAALAILSFLRRGTIVRAIVAGLLGIFAIFAWTFLTTMAKLPPYTGPISTGKTFPAFNSKFADGSTFDQSHLVGDQTTAVVFYRGRWCMLCMKELKRLEDRHADFASKNIRIVAVSLDPQDEADKSQKQFPHLKIVADTDQKLIAAAGVLHEKAKPDGGDAAAPTTILVDKSGIVRWVHRPDGIFQRLTPDEILAAVDREGK